MWHSATKGKNMINYYFSEDKKLSKTSVPQNGCWASAIAPTDQELNILSEYYNLDKDILQSALDADERSRIDNDTGYIMILVNIPAVEEHKDSELYSTIPLSIIIVDNAIITVCSEETPIINGFENNRIKDFYTQMKSRFVLQILYQIDTLYMQYLHNIDKKSDEVENKLHKSTKNRELIELLKLEKSLVYFTTALRSNESVLGKLLRSELVKKYAEDAELLEDVIVENKQAIEMANIYSGILSGMMDAFASVISNNLNIVMKVLAIVTIVMAIPTMLFSAYGMNVNTQGMPFAQSPWGFQIIIGLAVVLSVIAAIAFNKIKWFK